MKLVKIAKNTFVDPTKISAVMFSLGLTNTNATVVVEGLAYQSDLSTADLIQILVGSGVEYNEQFFAG